jgi:hypothetical protein
MYALLSLYNYSGGTKAVHASTLKDSGDKPLFDASVAFYASRVDEIFPYLAENHPLCPVWVQLKS